MRVSAGRVIMLGGDFADRLSALLAFEAMVRRLAGIALTVAIPGNHDIGLGVEAVRAALLAGGGMWLPD